MHLGHDVVHMLQVGGCLICSHMQLVVVRLGGGGGVCHVWLDRSTRASADRGKA